LEFKNKVIYHCSDCDCDGISARVIAEYYIKPYCKEYIPYNTADRLLPQFSFDVIKESDICIFTDITPPTLEYYNKIKEINPSIEIWCFDHHETGKNILKNLDNYFYDDTRCGTKIFYDYLTRNKRKNKALDDYVYLVNTYDMWKTDSKDFLTAKCLHNAMYGYVNWYKDKDTADTFKYISFIQTQLNKFNNKDHFYFTEFEKEKIKSALQKEETSYKKAKQNIKFRTDNQGNDYIYTECNSKISFVAHRLLKEYSNIKYLIIHGTFESSSTKLSIRCTGDFECNKLAEKWGGGGHRQSAGVEMKLEDFNNFREGKIHLI
jgi:oligoribonuclease NrnB/cAMP/cGMP phosphodiesterase (DHH superfamily)